MTEDQIRGVCRLYYLDCKPVSYIAQRYHVSRDEVLRIIDDPAVQSEHLRKAEGARKRTRARAAHAAELAIEKQVEFLQRDVGDELIPAQQRTARALLGLGLREDESRGEIRISFGGDEIRIGMPQREASDFEGTFTHEATEAQLAGLREDDPR